MSAKVIPIRGEREALKWGDSWERAYRDLFVQWRHEASELEWRILMLEVALTIERAERSIERYAKDQEIARLRGLL